MPTQKDKKFPFHLGADPEFSVILGENRIPADRILRILFKEKQVSNTEEGYKINRAGELGWDGHHITGELRPAPEYTPQKLTENIGELLKAFTDKSQLLELSTNSDKAPVGGHLHFEISPELAGNQAKLRILHKKMALFYIPIMIGEDLVNSRLRIKNGYGKLKDFHSQPTPDGIHYTYEFRCPNAEWLTTPKIAKATIAYFATIFNEIINHPENIKKIKNVMIQNESQIQALQELALTRYVSLTESILHKVKKHIKTFEYYESYKEEISYIFTPQKILRDKEKVNFEITNGWKLVKNKTPNKKDLMNEKKMKSLAEKTSIDEIAGAISIPYNPDDSKCADFSKALKDRIIAYNWKLKYNYFIFGLRKGIKNYIITNGDYKILEGKDIKNNKDIETMETIITKMIGKYKTATNKYSMKKEELQNIIFIGIPYKNRIDLKTKEFISTIHEIENRRKTPIERKELLKIINNKSEGILFNVYNKSQPNTNIITDESRNNQRDNENDTEEIRNELDSLTL